jgi:hypothetical protein
MNNAVAAIISKGSSDPVGANQAIYYFTNAPWTKNQTNYLMIPFRDGASQLEFEVISTQFNQLGLPVNSKVIIKKQNVFKSTSCADNRLSNCFETNQVTNFAANLYRN